MKSKAVGILGGMGPEATILLQQRILQSVDAKDDSDHIRLLIDMNPQVPSRVAHLIQGTGRDPGPVLAQMAQRLEDMGASALVMPCNTAHHYAEQITKGISIPFLNMVALSADHAAQLLGTGGKVGMLASPAVQKAELFSKALKARGIEDVWPQDGARMLSAIQMIKSNGPTKQSRGVLQKASQELYDRGAQLQFVACTEFSLISDSAHESAQVIDTLDILVSAIRNHIITSD